MTVYIPGFLRKVYEFVYFIFVQHSAYYRGRDSSVGIATGYGLDGPGIESRWLARFFAHRLALRHAQPPVQWVPGFSRG
jgi:hypothetical protein